MAQEKTAQEKDKVIALRSTMDSVKQSFALELARQRERFSKELDAKDKEIKSLKAQIDVLNFDLQEKAKKSERTINEHLENIRSLESLTKQLQNLLAGKETEIDTQQKRMTEQKLNYEKQIDEQNVKIETLHTTIRKLEEESSLIKSRLQDEQNKWDEILQMKEKDFNVLKREMEKKIKEWEAEYQKGESEIQIVRDRRNQLEEELKKAGDRMKELELEYKEQIFAKDREIQALKDTLDSNEKSWQRRLGDIEIDKWKQEVDAMIKSANTSLAEERSTEEEPK
ncbi:MAG: hypothetical protein AB1349_04935 [Elusimicrobiota bacterium]